MPTMTPAAQHVLNQACLRQDLPLDGWEHFLTSCGDDGVSRFVFDRDAPEGSLTLRVEVSGNGVTDELRVARKPAATSLRPPCGYALLDRSTGRVIVSHHGRAALDRARAAANAHRLTGYLSVVALDERGEPFGPDNLR
jgi:hypothetical protein